jgi:hypothetical protein
VRLPLGQAHDLLLGRLPGRLLARLRDQPLGLALGLGEHLLPLLDDPARLLDLLGDRGAHLVDDLPDLLAVHAHLILGERHAFGVLHQFVELVDQHQDVQRLISHLQISPLACISMSRRATGSGT